MSKFQRGELVRHIINGYTGEVHYRYINLAGQKAYVIRNQVTMEKRHIGEDDLEKVK